MTTSPAYKAAWTPERRAAQAERMRVMRTGSGKKTTDAAAATAKEKRAVEKARRAKQRSNLARYMEDSGIARKTPEQREQDRDRRKAAEPSSRADTPAIREYDWQRKWPQSLAELKQGCEPYGDATVAFAIATALLRWACDGIATKGNATGSPSNVIRECIDLHRDEIWRDLGVNRAGVAVLRNLSPQSQCEARRVYAETLLEWQAAGSPGLSHPELHEAYGYLRGQVWSGCLAPFPGCPECPPILLPKGTT